MLSRSGNLIIVNFCREKYRKLQSTTETLWWTDQTFESTPETPESIHERWEIFRYLWADNSYKQYVLTTDDMKHKVFTSTDTNWLSFPDGGSRDSCLYHCIQYNYILIQQLLIHLQQLRSNLHFHYHYIHMYSNYIPIYNNHILICNN